MAISDGQGYTLRRVGRLGVGGEGIEKYGYTPELPVDNKTKLAYRWSYKMDPIVPAGMVGQNERVGR